MIPPSCSRSLKYNSKNYIKEPEPSFYFLISIFLPQANTLEQTNLHKSATHTLQKSILLILAFFNMPKNNKSGRKGDKNRGGKKAFQLTYCLES